MHISYTNNDGETIVAALGSNVSPEQYAARLGLDSGAWKAITAAEAAALQDAEGAKKQEAKQLILAALQKTDEDSVRSMRAVLAGTGTDTDREKVVALDQKAEALRAELRELEGEK